MGVGGLEVRCAQSSGEWPGSRSTFLDGRAEGARVDVEGAREELGGAREREGGARNVDAVDGGGRRDVEGFGGVRLAGFEMSGRDGGGIEGLVVVCAVVSRVMVGGINFSFGEEALSTLSDCKDLS